MSLVALDSLVDGSAGVGGPREGAHSCGSGDGSLGDGFSDAPVVWVREVCIATSTRGTKWRGSPFAGAAGEEDPARRGGGGGGGLLKRAELLGEGAYLRLESGEAGCRSTRGQYIGIAGAVRVIPRRLVIEEASMELGPEGVEIRHPRLGFLSSVAPLEPVDE